MAGMTEPLFLDAEGSQAAGYAGRLVPGALTFAYAEGLVMQTNVIHGTGLAFMHAGLDVRNPVFTGDSITVVVEVLQSRPSGSGARGVVTTRNTVFNQDGAVVMVYEPVRLIKGRSYQEPDATAESAPLGGNP
jgi:acyl dehydratase